MRRWFWLPMLVGVLAVGVWAFVTSWPPSIVEVDIDQHRADTAPIVPDGVNEISQTFRPQRDGLLEIELLIAKFERPDSAESQLILQLTDDLGNLVAQEFLPTSGLEHNQKYTVRFVPQDNSAERTYTLTLRGQDNANTTVWGYGHDVYAAGALTQPMPGAAQDLRFITRYRLSFTSAIQQLQALQDDDSVLLLVSLLFIPLPGLLLIQGRDVFAVWRSNRAGQVANATHAPEVSAMAAVGLALALGCALWALTWQWMTVIDRHWWPSALWVSLMVGWLVVLGEGIYSVRYDEHHVKTRYAFAWQDGVLVVLLAVALAVRLLAVRDLAFPAWVDSSRHALITRLMALSGNMLDSYEPLFSAENAPYHYGFHTLSASLLQLLGGDPARLLLILGQLLNALMALAVFSGGWLLTKRRTPALIAAFLVALPMFFPAYYVSWGRYTQLTGMIILSVLLGVTWQLTSGSGNWRKPDWWLVLLTGVLSAGLFLVHARVFLIYLPLALIFWLINRLRGTVSLALAGSLGAALAAPRLLELASTASRSNIVNKMPDYNSFPTSYFTAGWERQLYALAVAIVVLAIGVIIWHLVRRDGQRTAAWHWIRPIIALALWIGLLFLILAGDRLGLPESWVLNLNAMIITLFLPVALIIGIGLDQLLTWLQKAHWIIQLVGYALFGAVLMATFLFGVQRQITIVNTETVLAYSADTAAIAWAAQNLPQDAIVANNSWQWLGRTWAGHDGGAWLQPQAGLSTTTPPVDYIYDKALFASVAAFNQAAQEIEDWSLVASAEFLRNNAVTHVYVGQRGGFFDSAELRQNPALTLLYSRDGAFIFELTPP
jgi:hypothetical protein